MNESFTWFGPLSARLGVPANVFGALLASGLLVAFGVAVRRRLSEPASAVVPEGRFSARNAAEVFVQSMLALAEGVIGPGAERYVPLLGTLFAYILCANLLGLVPGFVPPTSDFRVTFALGVVAFFAYHVYGFREHGGSYVRQFLGPALPVAPLMLVVELFGHFFRPVSLGIRLAANMFADHQVIEIFTSLTRLVVPVAFYVLGAFISLIQALVFTMLTEIYIALAVSHEH